jgi:outer membrane protein
MRHPAITPGLAALALVLLLAPIAPGAAEGAEAGTSSEETAPGPPPRPGKDGLEWSLGLGVISAPRPYVDADNDVQAIPLVELYYKRFYVQGIRAGFILAETERLRLDARARVIFAGFEPDDSPYLEGMEERRTTLQAGLGLDWQVGSFVLGFDASGDVLGRSDGFEISAGLSWPKFFKQGKIGLIPEIGLVWQDDSFVDYYAGVRPDEDRPDRPAYDGTAEINAGAGVTFLYRFTPRWRLVTLLQGQRLGGAYEESPLIDRRWGFFGLLGAAYQF